MKEFYSTEKGEETKRKISNSLEDFYRSEEGKKRIEEIVRKRTGVTRKYKRENYKKNPSKCEICKEELSYENRTRKTCSEECCRQLLRENVEDIDGFGDGINPSKTFWYYNEYQDEEVALDSSWELEYAKYLDENDIEWKRPSFLEWRDQEGNDRKYYPDFYLVEEDSYVDVKNDYLASLDETKYKVGSVENYNNIEVKVLDKEKLKNLEVL